MLDVGSFSRSFDGLRIFSGCSDGSCGPGRSLGCCRSGGFGGFSWFGGSCESDFMTPWYPLDPKGISIGSMAFDNPKVNGDKFILDGLVYVARLGSASLKIVQNKKRDKETLEKLILHNIVQLFASGDSAGMKVLTLLLFCHFQLT